MVERHRGGGGRPPDRGRNRDGGREGGRPGRDQRDSRDDRGRRGEGFGGGYRGDRGTPPFGERRQFRPPPPPPAAPSPPVGQEQFEEVDADLAVAILETATQLTQLVGASGLPDGYVERREAVLETFEAIYYQVLETVTGGEAEEEEEPEEEE